MRIIFSLLLCLLVMPVTQAWAVPGPEAWQKQLQAEFDRILEESTFMSVTSDIVVTEAGNGEMRAVFPRILFTAEDKSQWVVPNISMTATPSDVIVYMIAPVTVQLPSAITHISADEKIINKLLLGTQSLKGKWNFNTNAFDNFSGIIKNVDFTDMQSGTKTAASYVSVQTEDAKSIKIVAMGVNGVKNEDTGVAKASVENIVMNYSVPKAQDMTLQRIIGLINPAILLAGNEKLNIETTAKQFTHTSASGRVTTLEKLVSKMQLQSDKESKNISARSEIEIGNMKQSPASPLTPFLPKTGRITGTISNAPLEILTLTPGQSFDVAHAAMIASGARSDIDEIIINTPSGAVLQGKGWLQAAADVPTGFVGRLELSLKDAEALTSTLQRQMAGGATGGSLKTQGQSLMLLMLLQGMGKQNNKATEFIIDLTPDGQVLVNGQNITGMLPPMISKSRTIPVAPESAPAATRASL